MKANHNHPINPPYLNCVVSNGIKDTNLKANHNRAYKTCRLQEVVSNGIKDTNLKANHNYLGKRVLHDYGIKDTNLKANHNACSALNALFSLFPMVSKILI